MKTTGNPTGNTAYLLRPYSTCFTNSSASEGSAGSTTPFCIHIIENLAATLNTAPSNSPTERFRSGPAAFSISSIIIRSQAADKSPRGPQTSFSTTILTAVLLPFRPSGNSHILCISSGSASATAPPLSNPLTRSEFVFLSPQRRKLKGLLLHHRSLPVHQTNH